MREYLRVETRVAILVLVLLIVFVALNSGWGDPVILVAVALIANLFYLVGSLWSRWKRDRGN